MMPRALLLSAILVQLLVTSVAEAEDSVNYRLDFSRAARHRVQITVEVPVKPGEELVLFMPVWTPGSYLVREYARHVEWIEARNLRGEALPIHKITKNRWKVEPGEARRVEVEYRLYGREMSVRTNWIERDFAVLNGAATFITRVGSEEAPHRIDLVLPENWKKSATALRLADAGQPHVYVAADLDELVDSPIVLGNPEVVTFEEGGVPHQLVHLGGEPVWKASDSVEDVRRIVREHQRFWGNVPYDRYLFLNLVTESRGGLEHDHSTLLMTSRWVYRDRKRYLGWLALVSHEFFHTWNVRRLRPAELREYDYEKETYFRTLWIAEGVTSYYDDLVLARAGVCTQKEYLELLSRNLQAVERTPGRLVQSLSDSSHDTWVKFYRPDENSVNSTVSYYSKGAVVSFLLDATIRSLTGDRKSLDDVMRQLYRERVETGFTAGDFRRISSEVAGADLSDWFVTHVDRPGKLDYQPALDWLGLRFKPGPKADEKKKDGEDEKRGEVTLGVGTRETGGKVEVSRVLLDQPAFRAGVNVDDEILAIDGFRVSPGGLATRLKQYRPRDRIRLLVSRRQKLLELDVVLAEKPVETWSLELLPDASPEQEARRQSWLGSRQEL